MIPPDERLLTLTEAAAYLRDVRGVRRSVDTIRLWAARGVKGVRLETLHAGGRVHTSAEALQRFFEATTPVPVAAVEREPRMTAAQRKRHDAAMERLRNMGMKV